MLDLPSYQIGVTLPTTEFMPDVEPVKKDETETFLPEKRKETDVKLPDIETGIITSTDTSVRQCTKLSSKF